MDTAPWPWEQDSKIREAAQKVGVPMAIGLLDLLREVLGDASRVEHCASIWSPKTVQLVTTAQEDFEKQVMRVNEFWTGRAADEFNRWAGKLNDSLKNFKVVILAVRKTLFDFSTTITDVYRMAIELVGKIAAQVVKMFFGIMGVIANPFSFLDTVGAVLATFIEAGFKLLSDGTARLQEYRKAMSELEGAVANLGDLLPWGESVAKPGDWQVRPAS